MTQSNYVPPDVESSLVSAPLDTMTGLPSTWCPGCGHGSVTQAVAEIIHELGIRERIVLAVGVGCGGAICALLNTHSVNAPHGRASDVATGVSRMMPESVVVQYSGDGDSCAIGLSGLMHACNRGENFLVIIYNNNAYGMTGGQMGPTTTKEVPTTTFPEGRDETVMGYPMDIIRTLAHFPGVAYAARCAVTSGPRYGEARRVLKRAFDVHLDGHRGIKIVDVLGNCNVNWKGGGVTFTPETANDLIEDSIMGHFVMGEQRVPEAYRPIRVK